MSAKDEAIGRVIRLMDRCTATTVARIADELEDSLEIGPYGVLSFPTADEAQAVSEPRASGRREEFRSPEFGTPRVRTTSPMPARQAVESVHGLV